MPDQPIASQSEASGKLDRALNEMQGLRTANHELRTENKLLREKVDALIRKLYGASSEKIDREQLLLMLQGLDAPGKAPEPVAAEAPRRSKAPSPPRERKPRLPEHLPVVEEIIEPEPVKACPEAWRCIGQEVTEQLDCEPARYFKRRLVRRKYVRRDHPFAAPIIAPLATLQDRCLAAPGLLAAIVVGKYVDHLPLYRQEQIVATRHGIELPRQTMAQWMGLAADWLRPIYERIRTGVLGGGYVQIDETPIEYLEPGHGQTKLGYLWACARPSGDTVFSWKTSRAASCLETIVPSDWRGTVQSDGYRGYVAFARAHNIRPTAIGKKNWLFIGAAGAGERGAILYTIVESCRRRRLDPFVYLREVLTRLPKMLASEVSSITPEAWAKSNPPYHAARAA